MEQIWIVSRHDETERDSWPIAAFAREADARARAAAEDLARRRELLAGQRVEAALAAWRFAHPDGNLRPRTDAEKIRFAVFAQAFQAERERLQALEAAAAATTPEADLPALRHPLHDVHPLPFTA